MAYIVVCVSVQEWLLWALSSLGAWIGEGNHDMMQSTGRGTQTHAFLYARLLCRTCLMPPSLRRTGLSGGVHTPLQMLLAPLVVQHIVFKLILIHTAVQVHADEMH